MSEKKEEQVNTFRARLAKLFSGQAIVRRTKDNRLKVVDPSMLQSLGKPVQPAFQQGYFSGLHTYKPTGYYTPNTAFNFNTARIELYRDYEAMDEDPILSSALDIYADECTVRGPHGSLIDIQTAHEEVKEILHNLFYDILNVDFNLWPWIRNACKYGDFYLKLELQDEIGIINVTPMSAYDVTRSEGFDETSLQQVKFFYSPSDTSDPWGNKGELDYFEVAHFRLLSDTNFLPYGRSMLEAARKEFKRLALMEDAMMIHRIMRAPQRRVYKINVGNLNPTEIDDYMRNIMDKNKKTPYIDEETGQYNLKFNLQNMIEDIYIPVRGGDSQTEIDTLDGLGNEGMIDDVEYIRNKMMAALKIPKAFLGYDENLEGKCVSPDTEIPLISGETKTVGQLINDFNAGIKNYVYSLNEETQEIVPGEIEWAGYTRLNAQVVRVHLDNEKYIDCTPDHKFLLRNGEWREAALLQPEDSLMPLYLRKGGYKGHYTEVYEPGPQKYKLVHRLVAEHYGMLTPTKVVHHKDFNPENNNPENLDCSMTFYEHRKYHQTVLPEFKKKSPSFQAFMQNYRKEEKQYKNHKVLRVEILPDRIDTCDLTISKYHNFATGAGVIIHNSVLAAEDVRFARTIERIQKIFESELNKIAVIHLFLQGFTDHHLVEFDITLNSPSIVYERQKVEILNEKIQLINAMKDTQMFSRKYIYETIVGMSNDEWIREEEKLINDSIKQWGINEASNSGKDPFREGQSGKDQSGGGEGFDEFEPGAGMEPGLEEEPDFQERGTPFEPPREEEEAQESEAPAPETAAETTPAEQPEEPVKKESVNRPKSKYTYSKSKSNFRPTKDYDPLGDKAINRDMLSTENKHLPALLRSGLGDIKPKPIGRQRLTELYDRDDL